MFQLVVESLSAIVASKAKDKKNSQSIKHHLIQKKLFHSMN